MTTGDTLLFDSDGNATGRVDQSSQQSYSYLDPFGACYSRTITTAGGLLTASTTARAVPTAPTRSRGSMRSTTTGSSIFGATVQILP